MTKAKDGPDQKADSEVEEEDSPAEEDSREGSLTKAPLQRDPMYPVRLKIKTKIDVIIVTKGDTLWPIALREIRLSLQSLPKERSLRIILMPAEVQKNLSWLQPQPCLKPTKKLSPLCDNPPAWFKHVRGDFCSTKMLPKDGVRPQLIPEHEIECLSSPQAELLYEYMKEDQAIDPVKLGLCEYQAMEPVNSYHVEREDNDSIMEVSPYEALVINDASKIGAIESSSDIKPQQDTITTDRTPHLTPEPHTKKDQILMGPGKEVNLQDMDQWSVFTEDLRYTIPKTPAPGFDIQGQGCLDFSPE